MDWFDLSTEALQAKIMLKFKLVKFAGPSAVTQIINEK